MNDIIITPKKPHYRVINPIDCKGCIYMPAKEKRACKSCGNWNDRLVKK